MATHEHVAATTPDLRVEQIDTLKQLFPDAVTEGKIDFDLLKTILGAAVDTRPERYSFSWAGKRAAIRAAQTSSAMTLVPAPGESIDFDTTANLFIEGDNLEVLKLLHRPYFGRVKMIYIDPPYNTGNDFVYPDDYADPVDNYLSITGQRGENGLARTSNSETGGRYHSNWLKMMYPRLMLARSLLRDDGAIFISIDDHELANLRVLMDTVFGPENFIVSIVWQHKVSPSNDAKWFSSDHEYIVVYAKSKEVWRPYRLERNERQRGYYNNPDNDPRGPWNSVVYTCNKTKYERPNLYYPVRNQTTGEEIWPKETAVWKYSKEQYEKHLEDNMLFWGVDGRSKAPRLKSFLADAGDVVPRSIWPYSEVGHTQEATSEFLQFFPSGGFNTPKPTRLMRRILDVSTEQEDLVLDFFAGSCTMAQSVLDLNREDGGKRRFVMVQLPEPTENSSFSTIADIGKERIRRVISRLKAKDEGKLDLSTRETPEDLGFRVFKLAPSNLHQWQPPESDDHEAMIHQMSLMADTVHADSQPTNVIWETALREGYSLTATVERVLSGDATVYRVTDPDKGQSFYICLDTLLRLDALRPLRLTPADLFICRDSALDDTAAANLALQCRLKTL